MVLLAGPRARVFKRFDQLGGSFVANAVQSVRILGVLVRFCRGGDNEKSCAFEQDDFGRAARLCEG